MYILYYALNNESFYSRDTLYIYENENLYDVISDKINV